jgi:hypothetical protein
MLLGKKRVIYEVIYGANMEVTSPGLGHWSDATGSSHPQRDQLTMASGHTE